VLHKQKYGEKAIATPECVGVRAFASFYASLFKPAKQSPRYNERVLFVDLTMFSPSIDAAVSKLCRGKAIGIDMIPDNLLSIEELKTAVHKESDIIFRGPRFESMTQAR
jgi:hypothetical protein